jgi:hypothetical protein
MLSLIILLLLVQYAVVHGLVQPKLNLPQIKTSVSLLPATSLKATMSTSTVNLMKNGVGAGVFSLAPKLLMVSSFYDISMLYKSSALVIFFAAWAVYTFSLVTETCKITAAKSYGECWSKTLSRDSQWIIQFVISFSPLIGCLANTIVLTDLLSGILLSFSSFLPPFTTQREFVAFALGSFILYPLCSLQEMSSLQWSSIVGLLGQLVATGVVGLRAWDQSYLPGGLYYSYSAAANIGRGSGLPAPTVATLSSWFTFASFLTYCYVTHYNAPKYRSELENPTKARVALMSSIAYAGSVFFNLCTLWLGISAFGPTARMHSYLLNNLSPSDALGTVARVGVALSILASTPLMFINSRNTLISLAKQHNLTVLGEVKPMAATLVLLIAALATKLRDISSIGSLIGGLFGTNIAFTLPSVMYLRALYLNSLHPYVTPSKEESRGDIDCGDGGPVVTKPGNVLATIGPVRLVVNVVLALAGATLSVVSTCNAIKNIWLLVRKT